MDKTYVGIKECGCVVAACVDNPEHKKDVAKNVKEFIDNGLTVERINTEDARERLRMCKC